MMHGLRKMMIALIVIAVAAFVPLNDAQANVLIAVAQAMLYSNAAVHIGRALGGSDVAKKVRGRIASGRSAAPVNPGNPERPWESEAD
jgi:hypothetical protein